MKPKIRLNMSSVKALYSLILKEKPSPVKAIQNPELDVYNVHWSAYSEIMLTPDFPLQDWRWKIP